MTVLPAPYMTTDCDHQESKPNGKIHASTTHMTKTAGAVHAVRK